MTAIRHYLVIALCLAWCPRVGAEPTTAPTTAPQPRRVTLNYDNADPKVVFEDLARQLGIQVEYQQGLWNQDKPRIAIHAQEQLVAPVLAELYLKARAVPVETYGGQARDGVLTLRPAAVVRMDNNRQVYDNPYAGPSVVVGPYLLVARQIATAGSVSFVGNQRERRQASLTMRLVYDPSDPPLGISPQVQLSSATDENGASLLSAGAWYDGRIAVGRFGPDLSAQLVLPDKPGQRIVEVAGTIRVLRQLRADRIEIPDILNAKGTQKTVADIPFTVTEVTQSDNQVSVALRVDTTNIEPGAIDDLRNLLYRNGPQLLSADGRTYLVNGVDVSHADKQPLNVVLKYYADRNRSNDKGSPPATLRWTVPTLAEQVSLPFAFKDLPLP